MKSLKEICEGTLQGALCEGIFDVYEPGLDINFEDILDKVFADPFDPSVFGQQYSDFRTEFLMTEPILTDWTWLTGYGEPIDDFPNSGIGVVIRDGIIHINYFESSNKCMSLVHIGPRQSRSNDWLGYIHNPKIGTAGSTSYFKNVKLIFKLNPKAEKMVLSRLKKLFKNKINTITKFYRT